MPSRIVPMNSSKTSLTVRNCGTKNGKLVFLTRDRSLSLMNFTELRKVVSKESKDDMSLSNSFSLSITSDVHMKSLSMGICKKIQMTTNRCPEISLSVF